MENNNGADQTARMRSLVCTFVVRKEENPGFSRGDPYDVETQASWPPPGFAPVICQQNDRISKLTELDIFFIYSHLV